MAPADEVVIRAALRDEVSRPVSEIRQELGQLRLALNVIAHDGRRAADSLERMEAASRRGSVAARVNARETRSAARALGGYARQARDATRAVLRLTGAVLGLTAAMRGARGLAGAIRGVQGETKLLIALFATLIPAAVPVAAVLTGAFLAMAGSAAVLTAGLPVLVLGLNGVGTAVSALASGDMDKINESFARLTDTGQEFATYLFSLQPILDQLRGVAQNSMLPGFQEALEILVTALPNVTELVAALGGALGGAAVQLATAFAGPGGQAFVDFLTANAPAINDFTSGLISLSGSLADLLIAFAPLNAVVNAALGGVLSDFSDFSDGSTGRLQQFIGYIEQAMGPVGDFLTGFGTTLLDLLEALGQPGLVVLGAVNDLLSLLSTLAPLIGDIALSIGIGLSGVFQALIPIVEQLAPVLGDVLITATEGIAAALIALAPHIGEIATFFTDELLVGVQKLVPFLEPLGEAFLGVLDALLPLVPVLLDLIPVLGDALLAIFAALTPSIAEVVPALADLVSQVVVGLVPVLPLLAGLLSDLLERITPLLPIIGEQLVNAFALVIPQLPTLIDSLLDLVDQLVPLIPQLTEIAVDLLPILAGLLVTTVPLIVDLADAFGDTLLPILEVVADVLGTIAGFFSDNANLTALTETVRTLFGVLNSPVDDPLKGVRNLWGNITGSDVTSSYDRRGASGTFGDTGSSRQSLTGTYAVHSALATPGVAVSNALFDTRSGDHRAGRALDLTGPNLGSYKRRLVAAGGWGEMHGSGSRRHLHAVYPRVVASTSARTQQPLSRAYATAAPAQAVGDTGSSRMGRTGLPMGGGGDVFQIQVDVHQPGSNVDVVQAVGTALDALRREKAERRANDRW